MDHGLDHSANHPIPDGLDRDLRLMAAALSDPVEEGRKALEVLLERDKDGKLARRHRVAGALALRASKLEMDTDHPTVAAWRRRLRATSAQQMHLEVALAQLAEDLGDTPWIPIKGMDLSRRFYDPPEERPTADLDILVGRSSFEEARRALLEAGWQPLHNGQRAESYLQEEGYAWQARGPGGALLELHYRLWGLVEPEFSEQMVEDARPDSRLPGAGRLLAPAHAFIVGAVHLWLDPAPRSAAGFRDLERIGHRGGDGLSDEIVREADRFDLQLPVAVAAEVANRLWRRPVCTAVARELRERLRFPERLWLRRQADPSSVSLAQLVLCRHLSRRRARHGLALGLFRRLWPHPGIVANSSDVRWPWPVRRMWYQLLIVKLNGPARGLARWMERRLEPEEGESRVP